MRGIAVEMKDNVGHIPIGLVSDAVIRKPVSEGSQLTFDDIHIPDSLALKAWNSIEKKVLKG